MIDRFKNLFGKKQQAEETVANVQPVVEVPLTVENPIKPKKPTKPEKANKPKKPKKKKDNVNKDKELATQNNEPYISILRVDIDPDNINNGSFELDWNDKFVLDLIRAGYKIKETDTDNDIVDRWFQTVCRNVALELFEQDMADPEKRSNENLRVIRQKDLGNGRTEVS
jgi:hypothetical protein